MPTGTITRLVRERGFGFINGEDGQEYFFHRSAIQADFDNLRDGQKVSFEVEAGPKGPRARTVRVSADTRQS